MAVFEIASTQSSLPHMKEPGVNSSGAAIPDAGFFGSVAQPDGADSTPYGRTCQKPPLDEAYSAWCDFYCFCR